MTSVLYRAPGSIYAKAVGADGMYIEDADGTHYLDMSGGAAVSCLGHSHPHVLDVIHRQIDRLAYAHTASFTNDPQEQLAERLAARFGAPGARVYFTSGGSEANETAMKMTWQYWRARGEPQKKIVISRRHSYHGNTFGVLSIGGNEVRRRESAAPLINWPRISPCYAYRLRADHENDEEYGQRMAAELEAAIIEQGADNVAAFVCETVVGATLGVVPPVAGYLKRIRDICDQHEILLIADEIMCGSGRTGTYFAYEQDGAQPDIVTLAKGLGGGYQPLAATVIAPDIADVLATAGFSHGHTYIGHPVACAAGCAVQDVLDSNGLLERTEMMGARLSALLDERFGRHPNIGDIRGRGLFIGIELVADRDTKQGFPNGGGLPGQLKTAAMEAGLICYPGGIEADGAFVPHILLAPPMILEDSHMEECTDKLEQVLASVLHD